MLREDQLDCNVEIGGGQHMETMRGLEKTEAAVCLCSGQGSSEEDRCGWVVPSRNIWGYVTLKPRVDLAEYE